MGLGCSLPDLLALDRRDGCCGRDAPPALLADAGLLENPAMVLGADCARDVAACLALSTPVLKAASLLVTAAAANVSGRSAKQHWILHCRQRIVRSVEDTPVLLLHCMQKLVPCASSAPNQKDHVSRAVGIVFANTGLF